MLKFTSDFIRNISEIETVIRKTNQKYSLDPHSQKVVDGRTGGQQKQNGGQEAGADSKHDIVGVGGGEGLLLQHALFHVNDQINNFQLQAE